MKRLMLLIAAMLFCTVAVAQSTSADTATWSWTAPTTFVSGTAIPSTDAITYNLYIGTSGANSEGTTPAQARMSALTVVTSGYTPGQVVCGQITAVVNGMESAHSNEACKTFPLVPSAPTTLKVQ